MPNVLTHALPWQFFLEDYGAKMDGAQCLVNTVNGSAVINTTPVAAPNAPTLSTATSGGTIAAGVYTVAITYVNRFGETVASATNTVTTTGNASTITVSQPAGQPPSGPGNCTGWYAYVSQVGQSTPLTRQQAAGTPSPLYQPLLLTAPPTNTGANPPGSNTTATPIFTSTAVDGGKNIMICGALGIPGGPQIDTIASVQSPTQATLSTTGITQTLTGAAMFFASDDRLAVDSWLQAMQAYLNAGHTNVVGIVPDKFIGLGTGVFQTLYGSTVTPGETFNTQMRLPYGNLSGQDVKAEVTLLGPGDNAHNTFWVAQLPNLMGGTFVSFAIGPASPDPTYGQQSIMSSPNGSFGAGSNFMSNTMYVIKGIQVCGPGWHNTIGMDFQDAAGLRLSGSSMAYAPTTTTGGGVNPMNGWTGNTFWQNKIGAGIRFPQEGNNADLLVESFTCEGVTTAVLTTADHLTINRLSTIYNYFGIRITGGDQNTHDLTISQWTVEACAGGILQNNSGGHIAVDITMDGENSGPAYDIQDNGNHLYGTFRWSDPFRNPSIPVIQGAANLNIINLMQPPLKPNLSPLLLPTGATAETFPREQASAYLSGLTSGTLYVSAIALPAGVPINNLNLLVGGIAFGTVTHGWYVLMDSNRVVRAVSADQTGGNWTTTFQVVTLAMTGNYVTTYNGLYYVGFCASFSASGEFPALVPTVGGPTGIAPILQGTSSTGQTTPPTVGTTMAAITSVAADRFWAYTS